MNPIADAPSSTASRASSNSVMPQILTRVTTNPEALQRGDARDWSRLRAANEDLANAWRAAKARAASAIWPEATLLQVDDLTKSVSKTHALLEIDGGVLWVHDVHSTNGVYVVVGDDVVEVVPGTRVAVPAGADLELGEFVTRVTFE